MLSDFQKKKFEYLFRLYDANNDGILSFFDFSLYVERFAEIYSLSEDSSQYERLKNSARNWWEMIVESADADNDDSVTTEEWMHFSENYVHILETHPEGVTYLGKFIVMLFDLFDENGNGQVSVKEYTNFLSAWGIETDAEASFKQIDTDGDGVLSQEDMIDRVFEFYLSDDPKSPGNHFYGLLYDDDFCLSQEDFAAAPRGIVNRLFKSLFR